MKIIEVEQGSPEWHQARAGKVTASRIADMMAKTKTGWGASRKNYAAQLICERLTGVVEDGYKSPAMQRGTEMEPEARNAYGIMSGLELAPPVGFVLHPSIEMSGCSPDSLVGDDGLVEIKCPNTATHIETLLAEQVPSKYLLQMQWQMACTGRRWCDYVSYDGRVPPEMALFMSRIERDDDLIETLECEARAFLSEIDETVEQLRRKYLES